MAMKAKIPSRASLEILQLAKEMRANETMNEDNFRIIKLPEFADADPTAAPRSAEDIRALRKGAYMCQAVLRNT